MLETQRNPVLQLSLHKLVLNYYYYLWHCVYLKKKIFIYNPNSISCHYLFIYSLSLFISLFSSLINK